MPHVCPGADAERSKALNDVRVVNESQVQSKETKTFAGRIFIFGLQMRGLCPCLDVAYISAERKAPPTRQSGGPRRPCTAGAECAAPAARIPAAPYGRGTDPA